MIGNQLIVIQNRGIHEWPLEKAGGTTLSLKEADSIVRMNLLGICQAALVTQEGPGSNRQVIRLKDWKTLSTSSGVTVSHSVEVISEIGQFSWAYPAGLVPKVGLKLMGS